MERVGEELLRVSHLLCDAEARAEREAEARRGAESALQAMAEEAARRRKEASLLRGAPHSVCVCVYVRAGACV